MEIQIGIDTLCFYHNLSPKQKKTIMKELKILFGFMTINADYEHDSYD